MLEEQKPKAMLIGGGIVAVVIIILVIVGVVSMNKRTATPSNTQDSTLQKDTAKSVVSSTTKKTSTSADLIAIVNKDSILRSVDGGDSFESYFKIPVLDKKAVSPNVLGITFHPLTKDLIIVGTYDDGLFSRSTSTNLWNTISFPPKKIYSFVLDKKDPDQRMLASGVVSENGRIFRTVDGGKTWKAVYVEPGLKTTITALSQDPRDMNNIYSGTSLGTIVKSVDGGNTWKNIGNKIAGLIKFIIFDAEKPEVVYLLSFQKKIYYSPNEGESWLDWEKEKADEIIALSKRASDASKKGDKIEADRLKKQADALKKRNTENKMPSGVNLITTDPSVSGTIYAGTNTGLYRSTDFGKYWYELDIIESAKGFPIRSIAVNPENSDEIVFVAGKAFYKSQNRGQTWSVTPLNIERTASFVAYDPFNVGTIFIGVSSI